MAVPRGADASQGGDDLKEVDFTKTKRAWKRTLNATFNARHRSPLAHACTLALFALDRVLLD